MQPAASAGPIFQLVNISGKFQGTICPTTPTGSRKRSSEARFDRDNGALELVGHAAEVAEGHGGARHIEAAGVAERMPGVEAFPAGRDFRRRPRWRRRA